jgi:hypothetical protein
MSPEVSLLSETWQMFKTYVHAKEREEMAEALLDLFEEHIDVSDLETWKNEFDSSMKAAIRNKYEDEYDEDADDLDDEW